MQKIRFMIHQVRKAVSFTMCQYVKADQYVLHCGNVKHNAVYFVERFAS